jgi:hypothetical protein
MLRLLRTIGVPFLFGLGLSASCTVKDGNQNQSSGGSSSATGGVSGSSSKGGSTSSSGKSSGGKGIEPSAGMPATQGGGGQGGASAEAGAGGEGGAPACPGCASGFCLGDGTCVDCLPTNDHCASGKYCSADNKCVSGCKANGDGCASGLCAADHNCKNCIDDAECLAPLLCNSGACSAACTAQAEGTSTGCDGSLICCGLHCTELETDSQNCGSCGHACGDDQFCGVDSSCAGGAGGAGGAGAGCVSCHDTTLGNVCGVSKVIVILDTTKNPSDGNRTPGRQIGAALHAQCVPTPELTEAEQDSVAALNITTGRPVSGGGELLVVAGGPYFQNLEGYLESQHISPLYWYVGTDFSEYRKTADDSPVVHLAIAGDHTAHDFFIIQFSRDKASGSLVLNAQGLWLSGTVAAAYQITTGFLPNLASLDKAWYAYEWTDQNGDLAPDANEIVLKDSGN